MNYYLVRCKYNGKISFVHTLLKKNYISIIFTKKSASNIQIIYRAAQFIPTFFGNGDIYLRGFAAFTAQ